MSIITQNFKKILKTIFFRNVLNKKNYKLKIKRKNYQTVYFYLNISQHAFEEFNKNIHKYKIYLHIK